MKTHENTHTAVIQGQEYVATSYVSDNGLPGVDVGKWIARITVDIIKGNVVDRKSADKAFRSQAEAEAYLDTQVADMTAKGLLK